MISIIPEKNRRGFFLLLLGVFALVLMSSIRNCPANLVALKLLVLPAYIVSLRTLNEIEREARTLRSSNSLVIFYVLLDSILFVGMLILALWDPSFTVSGMLFLLTLGSLFRALVTYRSVYELSSHS